MWLQQPCFGDISTRKNTSARSSNDTYHLSGTISFTFIGEKVSNSVTMKLIVVFNNSYQPVNPVNCKVCQNSQHDKYLAKQQLRSKYKAINHSCFLYISNLCHLVQESQVLGCVAFPNDSSSH